LQDCDGGDDGGGGGKGEGGGGGGVGGDGGGDGGDEWSDGQQAPLVLAGIGSGLGAALDGLKEAVRSIRMPWAQTVGSGCPCRRCRQHRLVACELFLLSLLLCWEHTHVGLHPVCANLCRISNFARMAPPRWLFQRQSSRFGGFWLHSSKAKRKTGLRSSIRSARHMGARIRSNKVRFSRNGVSMDRNRCHPHCTNR